VYVVWSESLDILLSVFGPPLPSLGYHTAEFSSGGLSKNIITSAIRRFPRPYAMEEEGTISRTPLVDMVDKGDRYNLRLEIPGIDKDKIQLNATEDAIEISGEQSEEESDENKGHNYIYNERSYKSFYRSIPLPEEILPSKITARVNNGILQIEMPKKAPSRSSGGSTRIEIG
jgi:HSP20 family molecular chaperone IbpA